MTIKYPDSGDIAGLKELWQQAFGDDRAFIEGFFETGFSEKRCRLIKTGNRVAAALYWFDCRCRGEKMAYIYAVATAQDFRGKGLCAKLMEDTHGLLTEQGYAGAILVPAEDTLFIMYSKYAYTPVCPRKKVPAAQGQTPVKLQKIHAETYRGLRQSMLPEGGVEQDAPALAYLGTYCDFYQGEGFLLCGAVRDGRLYVQEFLGDTQNMGGILLSLGVEEGEFPCPGGAEYAMFRSFREHVLPPAYFGLPLD